jgi:hypothetical protein
MSFQRQVSIINIQTIETKDAMIAYFVCNLHYLDDIEMLQEIINTTQNMELQVYLQSTLRKIKNIDSFISDEDKIKIITESDPMQRKRSRDQTSKIIKVKDLTHSDLRQYLYARPPINFDQMLTRKEINSLDRDTCEMLVTMMYNSQIE